MSTICLGFYSCLENFISSSKFSCLNGKTFGKIFLLSGCLCICIVFWIIFLFLTILSCCFFFGIVFPLFLEHLLFFSHIGASLIYISSWKKVQPFISVRFSFRAAVLIPRLGKRKSNRKTAIVNLTPIRKSRKNKPPTCLKKFVCMYLQDFSAKKYLTVNYLS